MTIPNDLQNESIVSSHKIINFNNTLHKQFYSAIYRSIFTIIQYQQNYEEVWVIHRRDRRSQLQR